MDGFYILYFAAASAISLVLLSVFNRLFRVVEKARAGRVEDLQHVQTIASASPLKKPVRVFKERALDSISKRFSLIKGMVSFCVAAVWLAAVALPLLDKVPQTFISILVAGGAIIIGIAAKPFVENVISGIVLSISRYINLGDTVVLDEEYGIVEDMSLTHTIIRLWDRRRFIIANSVLINKELCNYSLYDSWLWAHIEFWVSYEADIAKVRDISIHAASKSEHVSDFEPPKFWIMKMDKEGIQCWVAAWARNPADAWALKADMRTEIIKELQRQGIQTHIYHFKPAKEKKAPAGETPPGREAPEY